MINHEKFKAFFSLKSIIGISIIVLIGATLYFFSFSNSVQKSNSIASGNSDIQIKSSGIDPDKSVKNVSDVESVIAKWIEANPEAIIQSVVAMQQRDAQKQQQDVRNNLIAKKADIFDNDEDPSHSPSGYNVSLVEFFDYNCGYCKRSQSTIESLIKDDKKLRIIFKELPILGSSSVELAKVAIAVNMIDRNKYLNVHNKIMKSNINSKEEAINLAKESGVDESKLRKVLDQDNDKIEKIIDNNRKLASEIGINGTPAFVIGDQLIPGAVNIETLKAKISDQRLEQK